MKKIILTENTNKELVNAKIEEPKETVKESVTNKKKYNASFAHLKGDMVSFKTEANEIKLKYLSSKNIDINPQFSENNKIVIYEDVENGIDLKYELEDRRLKESFIIKDRKDNYVFNFETKIGSLEPSYDEARKCLEFKKDNRVVCRMLPPFMVDNKGEESKKCSYEVENSENNKLSIRLIADAEWINSEERELPIIIDPTFEIVTPSFEVYEVAQGSRSDPYTCPADEVIIGHKKVDNEIMYYQCAINVDAGVLSEEDLAKDEIYFQMPIKNACFQNNDKIVIFLFNTTKIINANELFNGKLFKLDLKDYLNSENIDNSFTIKLSMISDPLISKKRGDIYEGKEFDGNDYFATLQTKDSSGNSICKIGFDSKEEVVNTDVERVWTRPERNSDEFADYDIGISGVTSVNIQSKIFKHVINDMSIQSGLITLNIEHIYNSISNLNGVFGQNWTISPLQKLKKSWDGNTRNISYFDSNGIEHKFYEKWYYKDGNAKKYVSRDDITLSENNEFVLRGSINSDKKIEYDLINDEGYTYVSLGSLTNIDAKKVEYKYYLKYKNFKKPVNIEKNNFLQFIYFENGEKHYVDNLNVELKNNGFVAKVNGKEKLVFLSSNPTKINSDNNSVDIISGPNKGVKKVYLEKVAVYENLDNDLYTSSDIENLEYEMNQAKYTLKEIKNVIKRNEDNEQSVLSSMAGNDFNLQESIIYHRGGEDNVITDDAESIQQQQIGIQQRQEAKSILYRDFFQLESELISAYEQQFSAERNEYFVTRNFNSKIKEQKESVNDYIVDSDGNIFVFDGFGRMIGVMDKHENKITISYNEDSNIENIKTDEEEILFKYNDDKKLESIKKSNGDVVRFNYMMDMLIEIDNNGRKTTFAYFNGFQVYCDNDDEIIIDNQTHDVLKVKKYVHNGTINQNTTFAANPFISRDLVIDDMFQYFNNFTCTKITDRRRKNIVTIEFDSKSNQIKNSDEKKCVYSNYDEKDRLISNTSILLNSKALLPDDDNKFKESNNMYSLRINSSRSYSNKTNSFCLKVKLNNLAFDKDFSNLKDVTLSVYYYKSNEKYNFKQTFPVKDNDTIVLPFFLEGSVSSFEANLESNLTSVPEMINLIESIEIFETESGILQEYDEKDRLWKIKTNEGKTTYLTFDDKLPIHVEFKDWNGKATTTDYLYDNEGKITSSIDSKGNCETYLYQNEGNKVEKKILNINDASLVRSETSEYDVEAKTYLEKGNIKDKDGKYPEQKTIFYPGTNIVKTEIGIDGTKTEYIVNPRTKNLIGLIKENDGVKNSISYVYNGDFLTSVKNNGTKVNYTYDGCKRIKTISIEGYSYTFISNSYSKEPTTVYGFGGKSYSYGSTVTTSINGGIYTARSSYDKNDNLVRLAQEDNSKTNTYTSNYLYNDNNFVTDVETVKTGDNPYKETIKYTYDVENKITSFNKAIIENNVTVETVEYLYTYATNKNLTKLDLKINGALTESSVYTYNVDKLLTKEVINTKCTINYEYDALNRIHHQEIKNDNNLTICRYFSYLQQDGNTLDLIAEDNVKVVSSSNGYLIENRKYKYDVNGRVVEINIDDKKISYDYDASGRLIKEHNEVLGVENKYSYDRLSNITSKRIYDLTTNTLTNEDELVYSCDGRRLLVSINNNPVTTDVYGRITSYNGKSLTWNKDGSLKNITLGEDSVIEYAYNDKGIRYLKKTSNGVTTRFVLDGNKILREESANHCIDYLYSTSGLIGFKYNNEAYLYEKNIFGDIIRIYNNEGDIVGEYNYDAFGNVTLVTDINGIAALNPFRYRGYYYDSDTGLYYLNYRYYDPKLGRFISPDDASYINPNNVNGLNIYAYCGNDPINLVDPTGHDWESFWNGVCGFFSNPIVQFITGAVVIVGLGIATVLTGGVAGGAAGFILAGAFKGALVGAVSGALTGGLIGGVSSAIAGNGFWNGVLSGASAGFMSGAIIGGITGAISSGMQVAKAASYWDKGTFKSGFQSMKYHYNKEVVKTGLTKGNSIIKYTNDALNFASNNGVNFTLNLSRNGLQSSWTLGKEFGSGINGLYTALGKIITFHYFYAW